MNKCPICGNNCEGEFCFKHKPKKPLKRSRIKQKKKSQEKYDEEKAQREADWKFYMEIWKERPHYCFETSDPLGSEPLTIFFHHILEKEKFPEYRYCKWNIALVSWNTHDQAHKNLDKTPKLKFKRELLLKKLQNE